MPAFRRVEDRRSIATVARRVGSTSRGWRLAAIAGAITIAVVVAVVAAFLVRSGDESGLPASTSTTATATSLAEPEPEPALVVTGGVVVDGNAHDWNTAAWDQDKVATFGGFQYTIYWDADLYLVLARRDLDDDRVERLRFPDRLERDRSDDEHRSTQLGISPQDGRLHLTYDQHAGPINYRMSDAGWVSNPPARMSRRQFTDPIDLAPRARDNRSATYVRMFNDPDGTLYAAHRSGQDDSGDELLHRYNAGAGTWTTVGRVLGREGAHRLPGGRTSRTRNAYTNGFVFDDDGRLHLTWTWRERAPQLAGLAANHDLAYAYSDDGGLTWFNNAGRPVADLAADDPITIDDPGLVVVDAPIGRWLVNQGSLTLDGRGQPHVFTSMSTRETLNEERADRHYVHAWRAPDSAWHWSWVDDVDTGGAPPPVRGDIVVTPADDVLLLFAVDRTLFSAHATAAASWEDWRFTAAGALPSYGELSADVTRFAGDGVLSVAIVETDGERAAFSVRDLEFQLPGDPGAPSDLRARLAEAAISLHWSGGYLAQTYDVYRTAGDGERELVASGIGERSTLLAYDDRDVEPGVEYRYEIVSRNAAGVSEPALIERTFNERGEGT
jgi:hypothetical protein